jgi:membrane protein
MTSLARSILDRIQIGPKRPERSKPGPNWSFVSAAAALTVATYYARRDQANGSAALLRQSLDTPAPALQADETPKLAAPRKKRKTPPAVTTGKAGYVKALWHIAISAAKEWSEHRAASKGAALALYTLFSLAPMLVLVVTIAGFFFGADTVREQLVEQLSGLVGDQGGEAIKTILESSQQKSDGLIAGIISAVLVLVSATTAFAELKDSLDELWEVPAKESSGLWGLIRERFLSFGLLLVLALMLLGSLAVSAGLAALGGAWTGVFSDSSFEVFAQVVAEIVSFAIVVALFAVVFKYLPAVKVAWRDVLVGALLTTVLFTVGKAVIGLYLGQKDTLSAFGAAGSIVALIIWIYYSAQIFFYGALFTHEYAVQIGSHAEGGANAAPADQP